MPAPSLPEPLSNNAVAAVELATGCVVVSVGGLGPARTREAISSRAYASVVGDDTFHTLPDLPGLPRLATSAVALRGQVYVLGGYDVAADASETSHRELYSLDVAAALASAPVAWEARAELPIAIDDAVALPYRDRYIIVVSGWSTKAPVPDVQVYDAERDHWELGTPFPGTPVFGHVAAILGDDLVVLDGVAQTPEGYRLVHQAFRATLSAEHPAALQWRALDPHPGAARYRAAGGTLGRELLFIGGTADPYNYDGLSYRTKSPSAPLVDDLRFTPATERFSVSTPPRTVATMDHRALASCAGSVSLLGGMVEGPRVQAQAWRLAAPAP
ncbi:MAG: hypothetical protein R3B48_30625 [Kofleriaceae bacterium]